VYLEMFAIFLVSFVALHFANEVVVRAIGIDLSRWMVWLILPVIFWPMARGASWSAWKHAVGWHAGKGFWREVGAGILGYLAGLPIVAIGLLGAVVLSVVVAKLVEWATGGAPPPASHPSIDEIGSGGALGVVSLYLLAAVWAPLIEETFFRGALYHHVRGRLGVALSALFVAFIFASIHPQGIGLIPGLMGLAVVFALIRQWRGSIIGCMVAHSMHNATLITVLLLALG
jgi:membrane protease YdiL (CAAX protease family)